jgi:hypothetical protein
MLRCGFSVGEKRLLSKLAAKRRLEMSLARKRRDLRRLERRQDARRKAAIGAYCIRSRLINRSWKEALDGVLSQEHLDDLVFSRCDEYGDPVTTSTQAHRQIIVGALCLKHARLNETFGNLLHGIVVSSAQSQDIDLVRRAITGDCIGTPKEEEAIVEKSLTVDSEERSLGVLRLEIRILENYVVETRANRDREIEHMVGKQLLRQSMESRSVLQKLEELLVDNSLFLDSDGNWVRVG